MSREEKIEFAKSQNIQSGTFFPIIPDIPKMLLSKNYHVTIERAISLGSVSTSATSGLITAGSFAFSLSDFPADANGSVSYTDFTRLFDEYRFLQVQVRFIPNVMPTAGVYNPLTTVIDYDDANTPNITTGEADLAEYQTSQSTQVGYSCERILTPHMAVAAYGGGVFSSYANMTQVWIDCASPSVSHYGVKWIMGASTNTSVQVFTVRAKYVMQFRTVR